MDSRFPTHYLNDRRVLRLSPPAFRTFVFGTAWSVSNMTDGVIEEADLSLVPLATEAHAVELVQAGLWSTTTKGWQITEFTKFQTSAAKLEAALERRRETDRDRQQRARLHKKGDHSMCLSDSCDEATSTPSQGQSQDMSRDEHVIFEGRGKAEAEERKLAPPSEEESVDYSTGELLGSDSTPISGRPSSPPLPPVGESPADPFAGIGRDADGPSPVDFNEFAASFRRPRGGDAA